MEENCVLQNENHEKEKQFNYFSNKFISFMKSVLGKKITIIFIALIVRSLVGIIFFGSIDLIVTIFDSSKVYNGETLDHLPYFPVVSIIAWLAGILSIKTFLPLAFCYKIISIIFDSLIAVLIYDFLRKKNIKSAFSIGLIYAISPVSIIINCIHVQWDSIFLFFLLYSFFIREFYKDSIKKYLVFGFLFGISFMIKPLSLVFILFFFSPKSSLKNNGFKKYITYQLTGLFGLIFVILCGLIISEYFGYNSKELIMRIFTYSNSGIVIFGLPMAFPFNMIPLLKSRLWIMVIVALSSILYYYDKIDVFKSLLLSFALIIGVAGLGPQYLIWIIPLLLMLEFYKFSALYGMITTVFLMLYYMNPYASYLPLENMASLVTLNSFKWLMPNRFFANEVFMPVIHFMGNRIIPLCALCLVVFIITTVFKYFKNPVINESEGYNINNDFLLIKNGYFLLMFGLNSIIIFLYIILRNTPFLEDFKKNLFEELAKYNMTQIEGYLVGNYGLGTLNIFMIMIIAAAIWSTFLAIISSLQKDSN